MLNRRNVLTIVAVVIVGFIVIQFVPGFARTNPPATFTMQWDLPQTAALMQRACNDCHTNETVWPWYSQVATSWLVVHDVDEGRQKLNFSTGSGEISAEDLVRVIENGSMSPQKYLILHPEANLTPEEKIQLVAGIQTTANGTIHSIPNQGNEAGEGGESGEEGEGAGG